MIRAILCGCSGAMGKAITTAAEKDPNINIVCGIDRRPIDADFLVVKDFSKIECTADVIIDFSHPSLLDDELAYCQSHGLPVLLATTGYDSTQIQKINQASEKIAIFRTANMSLGINLMDMLCRQAAKLLGDGFDIEIIEKHHNQKVDAPSGTALMLADGINEATGNDYTYQFDRHAKRQKRDPKEIGISSIRGGSIVGEHTVLFAGSGEMLEIKHTAFSKDVFAVGALKAASWIADKPAGIYNMKDLIEKN